MKFYNKETGAEVEAVRWLRDNKPAMAKFLDIRRHKFRMDVVDVWLTGDGQVSTVCVGDFVIKNKAGSLSTLSSKTFCEIYSPKKIANLYRKKPVEVQASQWFRNGDHPLDETSFGKGEIKEGKIVGYFRPLGVVEETRCSMCNKIAGDHGWVETLEGGHIIVCPGDWIITGVKGEHYPCKPDIFKETYDKVVAGEEEICRRPEFSHLIRCRVTVNGENAEFDDKDMVVIWDRAAKSFIFSLCKDGGTWQHITGGTGSHFLWRVDGKYIRFYK